VTVKATYELTTDAGQTVELSEQEYQQLKRLNDAPPMELRPQALMAPPELPTQPGAPA
jgi:hypothetical protein